MKKHNENLPEGLSEQFREVKNTKGEAKAVLTPEQRQFFVEAGRRGGKQSYAKLGHEHFVAIASKGGTAAKQQSRAKSGEGKYTDGKH